MIWPFRARQFPCKHHADAIGCMRLANQSLKHNPLSRVFYSAKNALFYQSCEDADWVCDGVEGLCVPERAEWTWGNANADEGRMGSHSDLMPDLGSDRGLCAGSEWGYDQEMLPCIDCVAWETASDPGRAKNRALPKDSMGALVFLQHLYRDDVVAETLLETDRNSRALVGHDENDDAREPLPDSTCIGLVASEKVEDVVVPNVILERKAGNTLLKDIRKRVSSGKRRTSDKILRYIGGLCSKREHSA